MMQIRQVRAMRVMAGTMREGAARVKRAFQPIME